MKIVEVAQLMLALAVPVSLATACGSTPAPTARLASSEAAIRSARELGAQDDPQAALHLRLADDQLEIAKNLMRDNENTRAAIVLERAKSDAELAVMLTREKNAKAEAQKTHERLDRRGLNNNNSNNNSNKVLDGPEK